MEDVYGVNEEIDTLFIVGRQVKTPVSIEDLDTNFGKFKIGTPKLHMIQNDCHCCS